MQNFNLFCTEVMEKSIMPKLPLGRFRQYQNKKNNFPQLRLTYPKYLTVSWNLDGSDEAFSLY